MSTRSGSRHNPYRRNRRTGSDSERPSGRRRRQPSTVAAEVMGSDIDSGGCIDLTANDTLEEEVIDLTDSTAGINYSAFDADPVVVISPADVDNAEREDFADSFRRESVQRRQLRLPDLWDNDGEEGENGIIEVEQEPTPSSSSNFLRSRVTRSNTAIDVDGISDDDLPDSPFPDHSANLSLSSPEGVKITCPVCMDSVSQIRRNRQIYSTTCGHIFCSSCIMQAIDAQHMCPTCRKRLTKRQIHQIFL